ncbi:hypothetical protein ACQP00_34390 [Dactylosporangium sp. CS-047395]|uniref:hypothetical protein n=1 Tax=Dactylosporangium sp. CS-047395 TaxID=3239936 RepID=UPI003D93713D
MKRLLHVPFVLVFAALLGFGSYALGFRLLANNFSVALGAAFVGGVVLTAALGGLTSRPGAVLLALPLAIVALTTSVYAAGIHHMHTLPRMTLVVAEQHCTHEHYDTDAGGQVCDHRAYTFRDTLGQTTAWRLAERDQQEDFRSAGEAVQVYRTAAPDEIRWWPTAMVEPESGVLLAARVTVPLLLLYTLALAVLGAIGDAATTHRFRQHMAS